MKLKLRKWFKNLPWKLCQVLICDLFGHKPDLNFEFVKGLTMCGRCMSPLKKRAGKWSGDFCQLDLMGQNILWSSFMIDSFPKASWLLRGYIHTNKRASWLLRGYIHTNKRELKNEQKS